MEGFVLKKWTGKLVWISFFDADIQVLSAFRARPYTVSLSIKFYRVVGLYNLSDDACTFSPHSGGIPDGKSILLLFYNIET